jgi:tryptophan synthase alpha chain
LTSKCGHAIARSIRLQRDAGGGPALIPYITAGFPSKSSFAEIIRSIAPHAAAIEIGVPFSDPMADGITLQRTSRVALQNGVTLEWILQETAAISRGIDVPLVLMGYLNPFLRFGLPELGPACAAAGVRALIIPDLPFEESGFVREALHKQEVGLVQLVSPVTPPDRAARIAAASDGFLYVVTSTGVTGGALESGGSFAHLKAVRGACPVPVCAGFGIRSAADVALLADAVDGVIVGSALAQAIESGAEPGEWLRELRPPGDARLHTTR